MPAIPPVGGPPPTGQTPLRPIPSNPVVPSTPTSKMHHSFKMAGWTDADEKKFRANLYQSISLQIGRDQKKQQETAAQIKQDLKDSLN